MAAVAEATTIEDGTVAGPSRLDSDARVVTSAALIETVK